MDNNVDKSEDELMGLTEFDLVVTSLVYNVAVNDVVDEYFREYDESVSRVKQFAKRNGYKCFEEDNTIKSNV